MLPTRNADLKPVQGIKSLKGHFESARFTLAKRSAGRQVEINGSVYSVELEDVWKCDI